MQLIADIGNSYCHFAVFNEDKIIKKIHIKAQDWHEQGLLQWKKHFDFAHIKQAKIIAVNDSPLLSIYKHLQACHIPYENIKDKLLAHLPCIETIILDNLGADRAANIIGAKHFISPPFIAVDCGTAITVDYCNEEGLFCGGVIVPGGQLIANSLYNYTDKLPLLTAKDSQESLSPIGGNSIDAITIGLNYGVCDMINGIIKRIYDWTDKQPRVILCGGSADITSRHLAYKFILQKHLTLWGCYVI